MNKFELRYVSPAENTKGAAVVVRNANKSFSNGVSVIRNLDMTVPIGSIYGLLGSSGCGKTTVLSCILGLRKFDSGMTLLYGNKPGFAATGIPGPNVGYMPQNLCLYSELTIQETLNFFGTLCGLSATTLVEQSKKLRELLDLPGETRHVSSLSGGQKRRLSFAVALIHTPALLILDEPTVGVDPLLRKRIWNYMENLCSEMYTTIIVTTHYLEECRQAHKVGFLKDGKMLFERKPTDLFREFDTNNLEWIVLHLSKSDETPSGSSNTCDYSSGRLCPVSTHGDNLTETGGRLNGFVSRTRALIQKNIVMLMRTPLLTLFVTIFVPILMILMCSVIGVDPQRLHLGLINKDVASNFSCTDTENDTECVVENLSCLILSHIPPGKIIWTNFENESMALEATSSGTVWGYIKIHEKFSESLLERYLAGPPPDEDIISDSEIILHLDNTNKLVSIAIGSILLDAFRDFSRNLLSRCGYDTRLADPALNFETPVFGSKDEDFREYVIPGAATAHLFFYPIITTSIRLIKEKNVGGFERTLALGLKPWEFFLSYAVSEVVTMFCQSILTFLVIRFVFKFENCGSDLLVILLYFLSGYGGVSFGFLLGSVCSQEITAAIIAVAVCLPNFILAGLLWPLNGQPAPLQYVSQFLPSTLPAEAARSIFGRGWNITHPNVFLGFMIANLWIIGCFILTTGFHLLLKQ